MAKSSHFHPNRHHPIMDSHIWSRLDAFDTKVAAREALRGPQPRLRRERNALSPPSLLPPEIVSCIMDYCIYNAMVQWSCGTTAYFDWTAVTQVYSYWREVALSCPTLWTYIQGQNVAWTRAFLERSSGLPLEIDMQESKIEEKKNQNRPEAWYRSLVELLAGSMYRTVSLQVVLDNHDNWQAPDSEAEPQPSLAAPILESLLIYNRMRYDEDDNPEYNCWFLKLIPKHMPVLRELDISHSYGASWGWVPYTHLPTVTALTISENSGSDDIPAQLQEIGCCANLEVLTLKSEGIVDYGPRIQDLSIKLPHLRSLRATQVPFELLANLDLSVSPISSIELSYLFDEWADPRYNWFSRLATFLTPLYSGKNPRLERLILSISCCAKMTFIHLLGFNSKEGPVFHVGLQVTDADDGIPEDFDWFLESLVEFQEDTGLAVHTIHFDKLEDLDVGVQIFRELRGLSGVKMLLLTNLLAKEAYRSFHELGNPDCPGGDGHAGTSGCEYCTQFLRSSFTGLEEVMFLGYDTGRDDRPKLVLL